MKNTGIEYLSTERKPHVLNELATLLPPLSEEQRSSLEADLLTNGCYSPIVVNEDMAIVDGHNRQQICEEHDIPYRMLVFAFEDLLEAKQWMVQTQRGRRNLEPWELGKIALKLREEVEGRAKARQREYFGNQYDSGLPATLPEVHPAGMETRKELAEMVGLGERTMGKVMQINDHAPDVVIEALDNHDLSVNQGYNITKQVQKLPEEEREQAAIDAVELATAKKNLQQKDAERERRAKIARVFSTAFEKAFAMTVNEENVLCWVECSRMTPTEMQSTISDARELSELFSQIADIIEQDILPKDWRVADGTDEDTD